MGSTLNGAKRKTTGWLGFIFSPKLRRNDEK